MERHRARAELAAVAPLRNAATGLGAVIASRLRLTTAGRTQTIGNIGRVFRVLSIGFSGSGIGLPPRIDGERLAQFADAAAHALLDLRVA